jgi:hypothetical protein
MNTLRTIPVFLSEPVAVDPEDYERLLKFEWYWTKGGARTKLPNKTYLLLQREVMGRPKGLSVGFLDSDKRNCRKANLFIFETGCKARTRRLIMDEKHRFEAERQRNSFPSKINPSVSTSEPKYLPLSTGGRVQIDAENYERYAGREWYAFNGRAVCNLPGASMLFLHRDVMGHPRGLYVGFLDNNKLNCQRANLFLFEPGKKKETRNKFS